VLRRKDYDSLLKWKAEKGKECLLIKGARQTGKTYLVREFGKNEYESTIEINFLERPSLKEIFSGDLTADEIYKRMSGHLPGIRFVPGKTLIFLDEIQRCANARTALKFLAEDGRFDVIASGSLLGLHYGQDADQEVEEVTSVPVGYERQMEMYSLDFEEYLWALGYGADMISELERYYQNRQPVPGDINEKMESLFREYIVVGGMPEAVQAFVLRHDYNEVQSIQEKIMASYDDDITSHVKGESRAKVRAVYASVPRQLAKERKKFKYSDVEKKGTARKFGDSIEWLRDANLVRICYNVSEPYLPLSANEVDTEFKMYFHDSGLLMSVYGVQTKLAVLNGTIKGNAKGGIYENIISEMLTKRGYSLHYYKTSDSSMEIEFLLEKDGEIMPLEVKAGNNTTASLNHFMEKFKPSQAMKLINGNIGEADGKLTLPHYMAMFL